MNPEQERKLDGVSELVVRIDERTEQMQEHHRREIAAAHARITEVRGEARQDVEDLRGESQASVKALRGEVRRLSGLISAGISAAIAAAGQALGIGGS